MTIGRALVKAPILLYRYTLSAFIGRECRYLPTCSEYALEAIDRHGAWVGAWMALARISRCHPWGASGFDPVPDDTRRPQWWAPWRHGRWRMTEVERDQAGQGS
jgi:putative membrane protein insertion efficiency factor